MAEAGVFPVPPTVILPKAMTKTGSLRILDGSLSYAEFLRRMTAPYKKDNGHRIADKPRFFQMSSRIVMGIASG
jgi:hypothetical protein